MDVMQMSCADLDRMVAKIEGWPEDSVVGKYSPSKQWLIGGPIIERDHIEIFYSGTWKAAIKVRKKKTLPWGFHAETDWHKVTSGETPLIAAMRCFVASRQP